MMTTIGFSYGPDILTVAPREDFVAFFELIKKAHRQGLRISTSGKFFGKGQFPLLSDKLWRGWISFDKIDCLEKELHKAKELFSKLPVSLSDAKNLSKVFALILDKLFKSIEGSRNYHKLGDPKHAVRVIVAEVPACSTMLRLPEEAFFKLDEPPLWTFYGESRDGVIVLDGSDW